MRHNSLHYSLDLSRTIDYPKFLTLDRSKQSKAIWIRTEIDLNECEHFLKANYPTWIDFVLLILSTRTTMRF